MFVAAGAGGVAGGDAGEIGAPAVSYRESILPRNFPLIQELGLEEAFKKVPHVEKLGAEFGMGDDPNTTRFTFDTGLVPGSWTFNIERAKFDAMLVEQAKAAGGTFARIQP